MTKMIKNLFIFLWCIHLSHASNPEENSKKPLSQTIVYRVVAENTLKLFSQTITTSQQIHQNNFLKTLKNIYNTRGIKGVLGLNILKETISISLLKNTYKWISYQNLPGILSTYYPKEWESYKNITNHLTSGATFSFCEILTSRLERIRTLKLLDKTPPPLKFKNFFDGGSLIFWRSFIGSTSFLITNDYLQKNMKHYRKGSLRPEDYFIIGTFLTCQHVLLTHPLTSLLTHFYNEKETTSLKNILKKHTLKSLYKGLPTHFWASYLLFTLDSYLMDL